MAADQRDRDKGGDEWVMLPTQDQKEQRLRQCWANLPDCKLSYKEFKERVSEFREVARPKRSMSWFEIAGWVWYLSGYVSTAWSVAPWCAPVARPVFRVLYWFVRRELK